MKRHLARVYRIVLILALIPALIILSLRFGLPQLSRFSSPIADHISQAIGMQVRFSGFDLSLDQWRIRVQVSDLVMHSQDAEQPRLSLSAENLDLTLDLMSSIRKKLPVFSHALLQDADLLIQQYDGRWLPEADKSDSEATAWTGLLMLLQAQPSVLLERIHVGLQPEDDDLQLISPVNAMLEASDDEFQISGSLRIPRMGEDAYLVVAVHVHDFDPADLLGGHYRFFLQSDALGAELLSLGILPFEMDELNLSAHLWGEWQDHRLVELQGDVSIEPLRMASDEHPEIDLLDFQFALVPLGLSQYQLQLRQVTALLDDVVLNIPEWISDFSVTQENRVQLELTRIDQLDLASLYYWVHRWMSLPDVAEQVLTQLSPSGSLKELTFYWPDPEVIEDVIMHVQLDDVAVSAWEDAPAASGITGSIHTTPLYGKVILESAEFTLDFPRLFGSGWQYSEASGELNWQVTGEAVLLNSGVLSLGNQDVQAKGRFGLYLPFDLEEQIEFSLLIGLTDTDALQTELYTPPHQMGQELHDWLQESIKAGQVNQAGLLIHAGLRPDVYKLPPTVQLFVDAEEASFRFDPNWPEVTEGRAFLHLRDTELRVDIASAKILNSQIESAWAYLPPQSQELHIEGIVSGDASDFSVLLAESELGHYLGSAFDNWVFAGPVRTHLGLTLPVEDVEQIDIRVDTQLLDNQLTIDQRDLTLNQVSGHIRYTTASGLSSEALEGYMFDERVVAQIASHEDQTTLTAQGSVASTHLDQLVGMPIGPRVAGKSDVDLRMTFCAQTLNCPRIEVRSNLEGTSIDLPLSLGKETQQARQLFIDLYPELGRLYLHYDRLLQLALDVNTLSRGQLVLGDGKPMLPSDDLFEVKGALPALALQGRVIRLNEQEWQAHFDHLHWFGTESEKDAQVEVLDKNINTMDVGHFPALTLRIDDLQQNARPLGAWSLTASPQGNSLTFEKVEGYLEDFTLQGHAHWQGGRFANTDMTLKVSGSDLAKVSEKWGLGEPVQSQHFRSEAQLSWAGAPWDFRLSRLNGAFQFTAEEGRIIESGAGANLLRVFGILNLNTLSRRLRLDFSDLLQKGLVFDQIHADYQLDQGVAVLQKPLTMTGPSANMDITGKVDLNSNQIDKRINVTVPLGSNLTLGAALLGAPHVAGALFIFDRIMGERIDRMSQITYSLTGDWKDPQLKVLNPADR